MSGPDVCSRTETAFLDPDRGATAVPEPRTGDATGLSPRHSLGEVRPTSTAGCVSASTKALPGDGLLYKRTGGQRGHGLAQASLSDATSPAAIPADLSPWKPPGTPFVCCGRGSLSRQRDSGGRHKPGGHVSDERLRWRPQFHSLAGDFKSWQNPPQTVNTGQFGGGLGALSPSRLNEDPTISAELTPNQHPG